MFTRSQYLVDRPKSLASRRWEHQKKKRKKVTVYLCDRRFVLYVRSCLYVRPLYRIARNTVSLLFDINEFVASLWIRIDNSPLCMLSQPGRCLWDVPVFVEGLRVLDVEERELGVVEVHEEEGGFHGGWCCS